MYCLMDVKWNSWCYGGVLALLQALGRKTKEKYRFAYSLGNGDYKWLFVKRNINVSRWYPIDVLYYVVKLYSCNQSR